MNNPIYKIDIYIYILIIYVIRNVFSLFIFLYKRKKDKYYNH